MDLPPAQVHHRRRRSTNRRRSGKERKPGVFLVTWPSCAHALQMSREKTQSELFLEKRNLPGYPPITQSLHNGNLMRNKTDLKKKSRATSLLKAPLEVFSSCYLAYWLKKFLIQLKFTKKRTT